MRATPLLFVLSCLSAALAHSSAAELPNGVRLARRSGPDGLLAKVEPRLHRRTRGSESAGADAGEGLTAGDEGPDGTRADGEMSRGRVGQSYASSDAFTSGRSRQTPPPSHSFWRPSSAADPRYPHGPKAAYDAHVMLLLKEQKRERGELTKTFLCAAVGVCLLGAARHTAVHGTLAHWRAQEQAARQLHQADLRRANEVRHMLDDLRQRNPQQAQFVTRLAVKMSHLHGTDVQEILPDLIKSASSEEGTHPGTVKHTVTFVGSDHRKKEQ